MLTFEQLQEVNIKRCEKWHLGRPWTLAEWTNALCGEAGEAANIAKKLLRVETGAVGNFNVTADELRHELAKEIADVVLYCSIIAWQLDVDLGETVREVFNKKSEQLGFKERL